MTALIGESIMITRSSPPAYAAAHADPCCSTGSSPGHTRTAAVSFPALHGGQVACKVRYEVHGPDDAPPIVVLGGISAGRHLLPTDDDDRPGWWPDVVRPGGALDPSRHRLTGVDFLGADALGSPGDDAGFTRALSTLDQAHAVRQVLDREGIAQATFVGASYGGMVSLAFGAAFPERTRGVVALCAAHRSHPMATGLRAIQRRVIRLAQQAGAPDAGVEVARGLAMTTYRSAAEFERRFTAQPRFEAGSPRFPVEDYLETRGADFVGRLTPADFLTLSESIDLHCVRPAELSVPLTLISFDTDTLVPPWLVEDLADAVPDAVRHIRIATEFGHDGFLKETTAVVAALGSVLDREGDR
jgi:homoserine O-acetyltransferase